MNYVWVFWVQPERIEYQEAHAQSSSYRVQRNLSHHKIRQVDDTVIVKSKETTGRRRAKDDRKQNTLVPMGAAFLPMDKGRPYNISKVER
jgi:hypothetical protein